MKTNQMIADANAKHLVVKSSLKAGVAKIAAMTTSTLRTTTPYTGTFQG